MTEKRSRGRPRGTGKDDLPFLEKVADLMVRTAGLKPTTAIKRIVAMQKNWDGASDTAVIRRWQVKWSEKGEALLAAAKRRAEQKPASRGVGYVSGYTAIGGFGWIDRHLQEMRRIEDLIDPPFMRAHRLAEEQRKRMMAMFEPARPSVFDQVEAVRKKIEALYNPPVNSLQAQIEDAMRRADPFHGVSPSLRAALGIL